MTIDLTLYQHPFASYCQKALVALYELGLPFEPRLVEGREELARLWPPATIPVLRDEAAGLTVPESTTIVEHLDRLAGGDRLIPADPDQALQARLWDRVADHQLSTPMQKIVGDELRPDDRRDPFGVAQAREQLDGAYALLDGQLADGRPFLAGERFTLADCAAFPPLFYLWAIHRWPVDERPHLTRYHRTLLARPSVARVVHEGRPFRSLFPLPWPADQDALAPA
jgi:glutathione S-transferase